MRAAYRLAVLAAISLVTSAHVGSPDAWFEGMAGPYTLTVHIEAPTVVPGIAVVNVKVDSGVEHVTAFVNTYDAEGGTPPPDELVPAADRPGWRRARLWVMNPGSNSVTIEARGAIGTGSVVVPLAAVAQRRLAFSRAFTVLIIIGAAVLMAGMLTLVGAAVREGVLEPGAVPDEDRRRRARRAMARAAVVIIVVLSLMSVWWRAEDRAFREQLYRPLSIVTRLDTTSGDVRFVLSITDSTWLQRNEVEILRARGETPVSGLVDDHGKLMHLFLVAEDGQAMAHLHPITKDTVTFTAGVPALPAGPYRVYADIVHLSGFTQTLTSRVPIGLSGAGRTVTDPDDAWAALPSPEAMRVKLDDGTILTWRRDSTRIKAGEEAQLRFQVEPPPEDTGALQPYLGMPAHAVVVRNDGQVFVHLHPMGTISPAAQARLTPATMPESTHMADASPPDSFHFPYAFPAPGRYTIWVQLKRNGRILTTAFSAEVQ
jgi:hypothetical protein